MKPILKYTLIGLLVVVLAGVSVAGVAYAQGNDPRGRDGLADLLGLTSEELKAALQDGNTIEELAEEAGVDLNAFHEEMIQNRQIDWETRIEEALDNGDISQDQADWLLEGLEKGYLDGPLFGLGGKGPGESGGRPGSSGNRPPGMRGGQSQTDQ